MIACILCKKLYTDRRNRTTTRRFKPVARHFSLSTIPMKFTNKITDWHSVILIGYQMRSSMQNNCQCSVNHRASVFHWLSCYYWGFSLSRQHQNHSTNKVKNQRDKRRWKFKQSRKVSGLCNVSCGRYSKKCSTQIYKVLYGDAMFVSIYRSEGRKYGGRKLTKTYVMEFCHKKPIVVFWGLKNIYTSTENLWKDRSSAVLITS